MGAYSLGLGKLNYGYISILALLLFIVFVPLVKKNYQQDLGYYLILSGGLSNIVDRMFAKGVIDFIPSKFFGSFNLADVFISAGAALMIIEFLYSSIKKKSNSKRT